MTRIAQKHAAAFQHDRTTGCETWLTPKFLIDAFDMPTLADVDPCSPPVRPWPTAKRHITKAEDGLALQWDPRHFYFVNPPYGAQCATWLDKAAEHGNGLTLIFARTETKMFHASVWRHPNAAALLFFEGRLRFARVDGTEAGSAGAPSVLIAYGTKAREALITAVEAGRLRGRIVLLDEAQRRASLLGRTVQEHPQQTPRTTARIAPTRARARRRLAPPA